MADKTESGYVKLAEAKIAAARVFAEEAQNEDRKDILGCRDFDVYFIEELKKVIVDSQKQLEKTWEELDKLKRIMEENNGKGEEIEEKIKEILLDELTDIAKEMKTEKREQSEDGYMVINTPMSRLHTVAVVYNTIWQAGGNRIAYTACV